MKKILSVGAVLCAIFVFAGALTSCKDTVEGAVIKITGAETAVKAAIRNGNVNFTIGDIDSISVKVGDSDYPLTSVVNFDDITVTLDIDPGNYGIVVTLSNDTPEPIGILTSGTVFVTTGKTFSATNWAVKDAD